MNLQKLKARFHAIRVKLGAFWNIFTGFLYLVFVFVAGIWAYMWMEGWDFLSSFYMVVITLSTVGFMEVHPLSDNGRIITIFLVLGGVGGFLYLAAAFTQMLVEGRLQMFLGRRRMQKNIDRLKEHFIVCGHGRIGSIVTQEILGEGHPVVVIEQNPELVEDMEQRGLLCLDGDATKDEVLQSAGLLRARSLITTLSDEAANVYVTLTARQLNPELTIIARANNAAHITRLELAGANRVVLPHFIGGIRMAQSVLRPTVTNFLELAQRGGIDLQMEELEVSPWSELVDKDLIASQIRPRYNLIIIAIKKESGDMVFNPGPKEIIQANDTLLAVGLKSNLTDIKAIL